MYISQNIWNISTKSFVCISSWLNNVNLSGLGMWVHHVTHTRKQNLCHSHKHMYSRAINNCTWLMLILFWQSPCNQTYWQVQYYFFVYCWKCFASVWLPNLLGSIGERAFDCVCQSRVYVGFRHSKTFGYCSGPTKIKLIIKQTSF